MTIASTLFYLRSSRTTHEDDACQDRRGDGDGNATRHRRAPRSSSQQPLRREPSSKPLRREPSSKPLRRPSVRSAHLEHELASLNKRGSDEYGGQNSSKTRLKTDEVSRSQFIRDQYLLEERLPGPVLDARARLTERLRSFHLTDNRLQNSIARISTNGQQNAAVGIKDSLDLKGGAASKDLKSEAPLSVPLPQRDLVSLFRDMKRKPSWLSFMDLQRLQEETFVESKDANGIPKSLECSICIERISNGDRLIRLNCGHRFHHACLEPWLQVHHECPYCRASIVN